MHLQAKKRLGSAFRRFPVFDSVLVPNLSNKRGKPVLIFLNTIYCIYANVLKTKWSCRRFTQKINAAPTVHEDGKERQIQCNYNYQNFI
jgi:hypothetical protein